MRRIWKCVYFLYKSYWPYTLLSNPFGHAWNLSLLTDTGKGGKFGITLSLQARCDRMAFCLYRCLAGPLVHDNAHSGKKCQNTYIWLACNLLSTHNINLLPFVKPLICVCHLIQRLVNKSIKQKFNLKLIISAIFKQKGQTFADPSFLNVRIWRFSLSFIIVNEASSGFLTIG